MNRRSFVASVAGLAAVPLTGTVAGAGEPTAPSLPDGVGPWAFTPVATYREVPAATAVIRKYTENPGFFRVNRWVTAADEARLPEPAPLSHYSLDEYLKGTLPPSETGAVAGDYLWDDAPASPGDPPPQSGFRVADVVEPPKPDAPFTGMTRYCYPFNAPLGAPDEIVTEQAAMAACKAMTARTFLAVQLLNLPDWQCGSVPLDWFLNAPLAAKQALFPAGKLAEMVLVINPVKARSLSLPGFDPADTLNPNHRYKLPRAVDGVPIVVENSFIVNRTDRKYVWPESLAALIHVPKEGRGTVHFRFHDRTIVETRQDATGNRGRIIEDFNVSLTPKSGLLLTV